MDGQQISNNGSASQGGSGFGVASMVLGIIALVISCCAYISIPLAILAVILGAVGIKKNSGKGMAIAGLICGLISLIPSIILIAVGGATWTAMLNEMASELMILL